MEEKFIAAFESNRAAANLMGIRMRPVEENGAVKNAKIQAWRRMECANVSAAS